MKMRNALIVVLLTGLAAAAAAQVVRVELDGRRTVLAKGT